LTNLGSEVEHDWALAGGLAMGADSSRTLPARSSLGPGWTSACDHCRVTALMFISTGNALLFVGPHD
jgi:hypothetical protein